MSKWVLAITETEYKTEEDARDAALEYISFDDVEAQIGNSITYRDLLQELARLDSPLYWRLYEAACEEVFEDYIYEIDDDEEEEEEQFTWRYYGNGIISK
jgi:hypothetical protein